MSATSKKGAPPPPPAGMMKSPVGQTNGGGPLPLVYTNEPSDDENMNEVMDDKVELTVMLPNGQENLVVVDSNIPMMDLHVNLARRGKLNPSAYSLQLICEENGKKVDFKAHQAIGALSGRMVHFVSRKSAADRHITSKGPNPARAQKPFEMTNRVTINLPHNQKTVVRFNPNQTLEQLHLTVCAEKGIEPSQYILQHPANPQTRLNPKSTLADIQTTELNLINTGGFHARPLTSASSVSTRSSRDKAAPSYMPGMGQEKKKRGFFTFLNKKEKKFKPQEVQYSSEFTMRKASGKVTTPPTQRRQAMGDESPRPKSMFVTSQTATPATSAAPSSAAARHASPPNIESATLPRPAGKKRHAPPPPQQKIVPAKAAAIDMKLPAVDANSTAVNNEESIPSVSQVDSAPIRTTAERLTLKNHSRDSSDSSGYGELTLSGAESPEHGRLGKPFKPSLDATSIESADNGDSAVRDLSPIRSVNEQDIYSPGVSATLPHDRHRKKQPVQRSHSLDRDEKTGAKEADAAPPRKKKAPAPPPPPGGTHPAPIAISPPESSKEVQPPQATPRASVQATSRISADALISGPDSVTSTPINDVPQKLSLHLESDKISPMKMVEDDDIQSEGQLTPKLQRPCAFNAPPPPTTPPPPETCSEDTPDDVPVTTVDIGVGINEDSRSLNQSSLDKGSPIIHRRGDSYTSMASINTIEDINMAFEETIAVGELALEDAEEESNSSYKHKDMAIFVEEMSKLTNNIQDIETPPEHSRENSVNIQDNQSDTGSVIRHGDSGSETGSMHRYDSGVADTESFSISQQSNDLQVAAVEHDQEKKATVVEHTSLSIQRSNDSVTDKEVSEITYNFMIDAVPTEFQNDGEVKKIDESMEEEETWIETIEEIEIKLTPDMVEAIEKGKREKEARLKIEKLKADSVVEKEVSSIKVELVSASVIKEEKAAKKSETNQMENVNSLRDSYLKRRDRSPPPVVKPKTMTRQRTPTSDGPIFTSVTSKPSSEYTRNVRPVTPPKPVVRPPTPPKGQTRIVNSSTQLKESFTVARSASPPKETFRVVRPPTPPKQQAVKSSILAKKQVRPPTPPKDQVRPPTPPKEPAKKEEFILSFDDLNKVDFLGVKQKLRKTEKVPSIQLKSQNDKSVDIKSFEEREKIAKMQNDSTGIYGLEGSMRGVKGSVKNRCSELSFAPNNDEELDHVLEEKSISMIALPAKRSISDEEYRMASESEEEKFTSKASLVITSPRLDSDSGYGNSLDRSYISNQSFQPATPDPSPETAPPTGDLQQQFVAWQQQLFQNQQLLSNQTVDPTALQVQQMQKQLEMQQQLMLQMQQNLVSLTLQNTTTTPADSSVVQPPSQITSELVQQVEATPVPPPPPPAMNITNVPPKMPSMSASNLKTLPTVAPKTKSKANPKRFEQKLAPREELMIAIRNRTNLKKVPIKQTNW